MASVADTCAAAVAALSDLAADVVEFLRVSLLTESEGPGVHMLLVAIDQRAVDVEQNYFDLHASLPRAA